MTATSTETATARAVAYVPSAGRGQWMLAASCPLCGRSHLHRVRRWFGEAVRKSPACAPHRVYAVRVEAVDLTGATQEGGQK